ncbi:MAG: NfeD family protein [Treponema sp.]|jgi:membrane protein implicated in regulation of membrane protease activity|nr:NfeD family protein [Treponema sp.]
MDVYQFIFTPWFWLALTILFAIIELATAFSLTTIWFALSALIMIFVSGFTELLDAPLRFRLHMGLFVAIAIALLVFTRPVAIKKLKVGREKTNVDDLAGRDALVTRKIPKFAKGEIKIRGQIWTAVADDNKEIAAGAECTVLRIEGVTAVVRQKKEQGV